MLHGAFEVRSDASQALFYDKLNQPLFQFSLLGKKKSASPWKRDYLINGYDFLCQLRRGTCRITMTKELLA